MKYKVGDQVLNNQDLEYADGTILPEGSKGLVIKVYNLSISYLVRFKIGDKRVSERFLSPFRKQ